MKKQSYYNTIGVVILAAIAIIGGNIFYRHIQSSKITPSTTAVPQPTLIVPVQVKNSIEYINNQYGFRFSLPQDWKGYSIVTSTWNGDSVSRNGEVIVNALQGGMISIRNPLWTSQNPYQDIPIFVFTLQQWNDLQQNKFHIGAAPFNPSKLGANASYVFALPARYNYAYPMDWQEVDQILKGNPLQPL
jgi:hypothetical protein